MSLNMTPTILDQNRVLSTCAMKGCLGEARWEPGINITPDGIQWVYIPFRTHIVCEHHRQYISVDDFITGTTSSGRDAWDRICDAFRRVNKKLPIKEMTSLHWRPA